MAGGAAAPLDGRPSGFERAQTAGIAALGRRRFPPFSAAKRRRSFIFNSLHGAGSEKFAPSPMAAKSGMAQDIWMSSASRASVAK
jgi:hypothetical protein